MAIFEGTHTVVRTVELNSGFWCEGEAALRICIKSTAVCDSRGS